LSDVQIVDYKDAGFIEQAVKHAHALLESNAVQGKLIMTC
jgi:hypothetical protein